MDCMRRNICAGGRQRGVRPWLAWGRGAARQSGWIDGRAVSIALATCWLAAGLAAAEPAGGQGAAAGLQEHTAREGQTPVGAAPGMSQALLAEITAWLASNFDLPAAAEAPRIALVAPGDLARLRFHVLLERQQGEGAIPKPMEGGRHARRQIVAFYDEGARTIYLPETWRSADPREVSVLVHEVVHHLQHMAGLKYACAQAREQLAFAAQEKWLALSGMDLESAFHMNRMTILLRTRCWH